MKKLCLILALLICMSSASGWECPEGQNGPETSFDEHISLATGIYLGKVVSAYLVEDIDKIVFELSTSDVIKGRYQSHLTLFSTASILNPKIAVGQNYIFFLYGDDNIDFCGVTIELGHIESLDRLRGFYQHLPIFHDIDRAKIGRLLAYYDLLNPPIN